MNDSPQMRRTGPGTRTTLSAGWLGSGRRSDDVVIEADLVVHDIGQLVTCEPAQGEGVLGVLESAAVAAKDGQVVWVGPSGRWQWRLDLSPDVVVVDAHGAWVLPGFVDARA